MEKGMKIMIVLFFGALILVSVLAQISHTRQPINAQLYVANMADSGQIVYVDVSISQNNIVLEEYSIHENLGYSKQLHIGDQVDLMARGGHFVGFCKDQTCRNILTTDRTYFTTINSEYTEIYAAFERSSNSSNN